MARWTDIAKWVGSTPNQGGRLGRHDGVVVHIADGTYDGTIAWQRNAAAEVSSHFIVARDGRIAQMVDTDTVAWTQKAGNSAWISIENEGRTGQTLTAAQVDANARILARAHTVYGVPLQVTGSPSRRGLGHHSMGAESGVDWGHSQCPGNPIKSQKPAIVARAVAIMNGDPVADVALTPAQATALAYIDSRVEALTYGRTEIRAGLQGAGDPVWPVTQLSGLIATVDELAARPAVTLSEADRTAIAEQVADIVADRVADKFAERLTN
jgi:hypothetical protein